MSPWYLTVVLLYLTPWTVFSFPLRTGVPSSRWEAHRDDVAGLDPERPLLPQLDLLSDQQPREAFRSMDPLAAS